MDNYVCMVEVDDGGLCLQTVESDIMECPIHGTVTQDEVHLPSAEDKVGMTKMGDDRWYYAP